MSASRLLFLPVTIQSGIHYLTETGICTSEGTVSGSPSFELNVFSEGGQATNIPLQTAPDNSFDFGIGLYKDENVLNTTPLPVRPPEPPLSCDKKQGGKC